VGGELLVEPGLSGGTVVRASLPIGSGAAMAASAEAAPSVLADTTGGAIEP